jgi:predicted NBD/HSP70 family sugar kinase
MLLSGAKSRRDLAVSLGVSKAAMTQAINRLLDMQMVDEGAFLSESRPGRKTISLRLRPGIAYFVGTDLEGSAIRACILDCEKKVVAGGKCAIGPQWSPKSISGQWQSLIKKIIKSSCIPMDKIAGIGVGLPGVVSKEELSTHTYLRGGEWVDFCAGDVLKKFKLKMAGGNNVACISEYERQLGIAKLAPDFVSVLVRYGIGASIYCNGTVAVGTKMFTGELGHMRVNMKGEDCICGRRGCLDTFASGRTFDENSFKTQKALNRELEKRSQYLGVGLANLLKLFHPPLIVLNGIYNKYENIVRPVLLKTLSEELEVLNLEVPEVVFGEPVEMKTSIGAAVLAAEQLFESYMDDVLDVRKSVRGRQ